MSIASKACPIVVRPGRSGIEVLAFEHPVAGLQLVKGGIEPGETPEAAAVREMHEEAGIEVHAVRSLGTLEAVAGQLWSLTLCQAPWPLADSWVYRTADDGGHDFRFFWQPLSARLSEHWALPYQTVVAYLREVSSNISFDTDITAATRAARARLRGAGRFGR